MKKNLSSSEGAKALGGIYLFYGDEFLVKEQVNKLVGEFLDPKHRATNLIIFDGVNLDAAGISSHVRTPSLFGGPRVIVIEQTTLFMGRTDERKLAAKAIESWKAGEEKAAFRAMAQLLNLTGLKSSDVQHDPEWVNQILGDSARPDERATLALLGEAFLEGGRPAGATGGDEGLIEDLVATTLPEETVLVFTAAAVDKRKKIFKTVEQEGHVVECSVKQEKYGAGLEKSFFEERVRDVLSRAGKEISPEAVEKMYSRSGKEIRQLESELGKLVGYVGERRKITGLDVEALFSDFHEAAFFELNNVLRTADIKRCLPALHENLKLVSHPLQTLASITTEFRRLMVAREMLFTVFRSSWKRGMTYQSFVPVLKSVREENPGMTQKGKFNLLAMKDYPLYLYLRDAQRFPMEKLTRIVEAVLEADVLMKSSKLGAQAPRAILENLVLTICTPADSNVDRGKKAG
ncbi:MAG: DNA polymerase III subunit delta [Desulfomonilaceae bacterium]